MTTEERLARLETLVETQGDDLREIKGDVQEVIRALHMGKGAGFLLLKIGAVLVGLAAVLKVVFDTVKH